MAAYSTGASWSFPDDLPGGWTTIENEEELDKKPEPAIPSTPPLGPRSDPISEPPSEPTPLPPASSHQPQDETSSEQQQQQRRRTHYAPRTCRICLESVDPTFHTEAESALPSAFQPAPRVTYESPPGDGGRMIRPCKCKGSQKYVHEECLSAWRLQNPLERRNYWQCPTCGYKYNIQRLSYARWISSTAAQIGLTVLIFVVAMFVLGFVADPIINLYLDPIGTVASLPDEARQMVKTGQTPSMLFEDEPVGWSEHFVKGLASLGLLGFAKFLLTLSPWHWFNMRGGGFGGGGWGGGWGNGIVVGGGGGGRGGRAVTGRDRLHQLSWITILIGIVTFLYAVWKGVRAWSRRTLEKAGERVMDVPGTGDDDDDD